MFLRRNAMRKAVLIASIALPIAFLAPVAATVATIAGVSATTVSGSVTPAYEYDGG
jgi:hypothetical protein